MWAMPRRRLSWPTFYQKDNDMPKQKLTVAIEKFTEEMRKRLREKRREGFEGWDDDDFESWCCGRVLQPAQKPYCPFCFKQYDRREIIDKMRELKPPHTSPDKRRTPACS